MLRSADFFTPSYLFAEGWVLLMQDKGVICQLLNLPDRSFAWFFTPYGLSVSIRHARLMINVRGNSPTHGSLSIKGCFF